MRIKKKYRILLAVLALCVLLSLGGLVYYHGEWWFPVLYAMRQDGTLDLTEAALTGDLRLWSLDELKTEENVSASSVLMLINSAHPLPKEYEPELVLYNGAQMHPLMLEGYIALRDGVQERTGVRIYVASDYRTKEEQEEIISSSEAGIAAPIGCSEHEAGLALDVYAPYYDGMNFLRSRAGRMVNERCAEYGYIIRYPYAEEEVTGISYEPWHLRYVGAPHAMLMQESGTTLEEYIEGLTPNTWYATEGYLIARLSPDALLLPASFAHCDISPDNTGYYIVTVKL